MSQLVELVQQLDRYIFILRNQVLHHHFMHVDHELVEFMPVDEQDYKEVIEEYEEQILVQEGAPEPFGADFADPRLPKASLGA